MIGSSPDAFLHAAAHLRRVAVVDVREAHELELAAYPPAYLVLAERRVLSQRQRHVLADRERIEERGALEEHTKAHAHLKKLFTAEPGDVLPLEEYLPGVGDDEAGDVLEHDALAAAAAADDDERLPPRDVEIEVLEHGRAVEGLGHAAEPHDMFVCPALHARLLTTARR